MNYGEGLNLVHGCGIIINPRVIIGRNCVIHQFVTIGLGNTADDYPTIGDNVFIGANSCIIGKVKVGNNVIIGAGSTVVHDIPDGAVVVGSAAKVIK